MEELKLLATRRATGYAEFEDGPASEQTYNSCQRLMSTSGCRWVLCGDVYHCHEALSKSANKQNAPSKTFHGCGERLISTAHIAALLGAARQTTWHAGESGRQD